MRNIARYLILAVVALAPLATNQAQPNVCSPDIGGSDGLYPDHQLSPRESLEHHDTVFLGEVVVPARRCSLGYCAGLRVMRTLKGEPGTTALVRIAKSQIDTCAPGSFQEKGARWMVFAHSGTSKTGLRYLQTASDGPSFAARSVPDFNALEGQYRAMRARLDDAINERLGRVR